GNGSVAEDGEPCAHGLAYEHGGIKALKPKPNGGRKHENMTLAEEKALLARFAKAAGAGEMLSIHDLKAAYEKAIGHATSDSTVHNLLHRHGWRKLMPRPHHPKRDLSAQSAFRTIRHSEEAPGLLAAQREEAAIPSTSPRLTKPYQGLFDFTVRPIE